MQDARECAILSQLAESHLHANRIQANMPSTFTYAKHIDTSTRDVAVLAQHLRRIVHAIILCYHAQRGWTAVGDLQLFIMRKTFHPFHVIFSYSGSCSNDIQNEA